MLCTESIHTGILMRTHCYTFSLLQRMSDLCLDISRQRSVIQYQWSMAALSHYLWRSAAWVWFWTLPSPCHTSFSSINLTFTTFSHNSNVLQFKPSFRSLTSSALTTTMVSCAVCFPEVQTSYSRLKTKLLKFSLPNLIYAQSLPVKFCISYEILLFTYKSPLELGPSTYCAFSFSIPPRLCVPCTRTFHPPQQTAVF